MTSAQIRQTFLDFFAKHQHTIVPSSSLMPDSPGLLFTNAGMNQFVPIFLNERKPDVSRWPGALPASDTRAADTQKCIRAGGKHNDLDDVGFDTYHHTMFEMLGNWSFGDYFKKESLSWGWELLTKVWGIPPKRLFATVYSPDKSKNDPASFDQEAYDIWAGLFREAGLDPAVHIVNGNKKDNFWMMGDTGPCGPCSEIHFNLLPSDDEAAGRALVNSSSPRCIEIWNHVFIQFNAGADGSFSPLPAKHVDTGMGFERVAGIYATTRGFKNFTPEPSNYNADVFTDLFTVIAKLSGKTFTGTVPTSRDNLTDQQKTDIAFRVLADHARTVSCAIADGILPSNEGRNYVIRRILRRGILYGRKDLGLDTGFFEKLVPAVIASLGSVFPELKQQQKIIENMIRGEEESFGKTLDRGLQIFNALTQGMTSAAKLLRTPVAELSDEAANHRLREHFILDPQLSSTFVRILATIDTGLHPTGENVTDVIYNHLKSIMLENHPNAKAIKQKMLDVLGVVGGREAFLLYDTYGFPLDMTQLLATERGLVVDVAGFETEMEKQRAMARAAQKRDVITVSADNVADNIPATIFTGFNITTPVAAPESATVLEVVTVGKSKCVILDRTPFYAEMGGQLGDTGIITVEGVTLKVANTTKDKHGHYLHEISTETPVPASLRVGAKVTAAVELERRLGIQRHHTATHLLHWALRKVLGSHVRQAGSSVHPDSLRFDFAHFEQVKHEQLREVETLINQRILENVAVSAVEVSYASISTRKDINQFFGDKYGDQVRVVQIGGIPGTLDGYSMELCGGTHSAATGELGLVKIVVESAIAAGTRRIEAVAGTPAYALSANHEALLKELGSRIQAGPQDVLKKLDTMLAHKIETEKKLKVYEQRAAANLAGELAAQATPLADSLKLVTGVVTVDNPDALRSIGSQVLAKIGEGVVKLGAALAPDKVSVVAFCSPGAIKAGYQAGKLVSELCSQLEGKGGGKPDFAMGGGKNAAKLADVFGK